jgi:hypothetical protein
MLLAVSVELAAQGHVTRNGKPFSASQVKRLLLGYTPRPMSERKPAAA